MKFNFDKVVNRHNTNSLKWDCGENELPMWVADMDFEVCPYIKDAIVERANHGVYGYSYVTDEFFESISNWWSNRHDIIYNKEWMIYSNGIVASISSMVRRLTRPAENVVVMSPVYNIFYNCILNNGRNVLASNLIYENGSYRIDFLDLEEKLKNPQTSLLILCNPHNPIGKIWLIKDLENIGKLCKKYNVLIISDEIHCDFCEPGKKYVPMLSLKDFHDITISCISGSKIFNIAGLQSACLVIPNQHLRHLVNRGLNNDEVAEPNCFSMAANIAGFNNANSWVEELNEYIFNNKKEVYKYFDKFLPNLKYIKSDATYLLWVDVSYYTNDSVSLCEYIRKTTGLYISDGLEYGENGRSFIRINLATTKQNIKDGLERLKNGLESFSMSK